MGKKKYLAKIIISKILKYYNYLFFHMYSASLKAGYKYEWPFFWPVMSVFGVIVLNIATLAMLLAGLDDSLSFIILIPSNIIFHFGILILIFLYYTYKGRYVQIYESYMIYRKKSPDSIESILIFITYMIVNSILAILASMYYNNQWIFK